MRHVLPLLIAVLAASPAVAQEDTRRWNLDIHDGYAGLYWAIPDSDDAGPGLTCSPGDGSVKVSIWVDHRIATDEPTADGQWVDAKGNPPPWPAELSAKADGAAEVWPAEANPEEMYGGSVIVAEVPTETPVLEAFKRTGRITLSSFGTTEEPDVAPPQLAKAFLEACMPGS